ncbi:MAG: hypothetical protein ACFB9M_04945 [Myxococcota bacterium]
MSAPALELGFLHHLVSAYEADAAVVRTLDALTGELAARWIRPSQVGAARAGDVIAVEDPAHVEVGNPHRIGSEAWFEYGTSTGHWFRMPREALDALVPNDGDLAIGVGPDAWERLGALVSVYAEQWAQLSQLMSRAVNNGASREELTLLAGVAVEVGPIGRVDEGTYNDLWAGRLNEARLGNVYGTSRFIFGDGRRVAGGGGRAEGALVVLRSLGADAVQRVFDRAQVLDIELFGEEQERKEALAAAMSQYASAHAVDFMQADPAWAETFSDAWSALISSVYEDPDGTVRIVRRILEDGTGMAGLLAAIQELNQENAELRFRSTVQARWSRTHDAIVENLR